MKEYLPILIDKGIMFLAGLIGTSIGFRWLKNAQLEKVPKLCNFLKFGGPFLLVLSTWLMFNEINAVIGKNIFTAKWQVYSESNGGYSIEFPGIPNEITQVKSISADKEVNVHLAILEITNMNTVYASSYTILPDEVKNLSEDDYLRGKISEVKNTLDPSSIEFHRLEKDSPCWKISGESKKLKMVMNYYIYKGRAYNVIVTFPKTNEIPAEATKFFETFNCWQNDIKNRI